MNTPVHVGLAVGMLTTGLVVSGNAAATALATPSLSTAAAAAAVINSQLSDTATLSGGTAPTGTITFALYGPADPTCATALTTSMVTVTGAGTYHSAAFTANTVGTYRWVAKYGGDTNNTAVNGACGTTGESVQVTLPSSGASVYVTGRDLVHAIPEVTQYTVAVDGTLSPKNPFAVPFPTGSDPDGIVVSADGTRAYVSGDGDNTVFQFDIAPDGTLSPMTPATVAAGNRPGAPALSADGKTAYVTNFGDNTVSQFTIAAAGTLTAVNTVATAAGPNAIALSPDGTNAYVVNFNDGTISQYTVGAVGTLSPNGTVSTAPVPEGLALSPDGGSAYVPYGNGSKVYQYTVAADGTLSPKSPATVATGQFPGPIVVSADGKSAYVTNTGPGQGMSTVSQYTIAADGTLSPKTPATVATGQNPADIALNPDGKTAYVLNAGDRTLWQYNVAADGTLSPKTPAFIGADQALSAVVVAPPQGATTTTTLGVTPAAPAPFAAVETITATVNPTAAGTVYFLDGPVSLGAPVPVSNGVATLAVTLAPGSHPLTAVFSPTDPTAFAASISRVSYLVAAKRPLCIRICP